ncbi:putative LPS assembly protein LptD [Pontibacter litorisediminis]|uniref:putative LPS assembly protein LptD n=1 Tax=Pontibacter litorisediminis TaxID=1846260 RepID=UPI0023EC7AE2|nr:putative LPS assembly protein LptD [Pontibacter litorisediminis]
MRHYIFIFLLLLQAVLLSSPLAHAQRGLKRAGTAAPQDTPRVTAQDTALVAGQDSVSLAAPQGDIATTIKYSARDSMQFEVDNKVVHLYGDAKINYGDMNLEAAYIQINYETNTLTATTLPDSTGKEAGTPVFKQGAETYAAKRIAYNYKTRRGRISDVVTQQGEGYIHSEVVKRNENNEFFGLHNKYTTCNLEHPHFYISASKIKAIPNDKVMAGPFNLVIGDIPTPLGFLFGLFPTPKTKRASGVIVPSYGENRARGFFLNDGGYYFAWNDYIGTRLTGDIFSLGGYEVKASTDYVKRYGYRGNMNFSYSYFKNDEADIAASEARSTDNVFSQLPPSQKTFWIRWSHNPVTKPGRGSFSASVNAGSQSHQRVNYESQSQYLSPSFNSNVSYQKTIPNSPFSYTLKASQSQNTVSGRMDFVLPDLSFSMSQVSVSELFSDAQATNKWYEKFTLSYNVRASNTVTNVQPARTRSDIPLLEASPADTIPISFNNLQRLWDSGQKQAVHAFGIGLGNYKIARFFNFSPNVNYSETWLDEKYSFRFDPDSQRIDIDTTSFGRVYQYSAGASLNTTVYGTVNFKQGGKVEAIRHLVRPSISYNFRPDFADERYGFYQRTLVGVDPNTNLAEYRDLGRFRTALPATGLSSALSFSIDNSVEMKVKAKSDTAEVKTEKVSIIDNLRLSSSYDFARDSLNLSPIRVSLNTKLFKFINMNFNSTLDPYQKNDSTGQTIDRYYFDLSKGRLGRITNAGLNLTASLNPEAFRSETTTPDNLPSLEQEPFDPLLPQYVDFKIPWTLNLNYSLNYNRSFGLRGETRVIQTMGIDGSLNITEKWKVTYNATYDISNQNISYANVQIYRDLHCWDMSIGWVPFGLLRGYNLTINARSALLQDLKLTKRSSTGYNY